MQDLALAIPRIVNKKMRENTKIKIVNLVRKILVFTRILREWSGGRGSHPAGAPKATILWPDLRMGFPAWCPDHPCV